MVTIQALREAGFEVKESLAHVEAVEAKFKNGQTSKIHNDESVLRNAKNIEKVFVRGKPYSRSLK